MSLKMRRYLIGAVLVFAALAGGGWGWLHLAIQNGLDRSTEQAQRAFPGATSEVSALIAVMQDKAYSLRERNMAVWALGQLRDPEALPALQAVHTGEPCDHQHHLCQRELRKAIELCRGDYPNILWIRSRRR